LAFAAISLFAAAREVVVLKGGARMELSAPMVRQGNVVLLTRTDGTMFSVPASEIDFAATAALKTAPPPAPPSQAVVAAPSSPAEAARAPRSKARVRITDNDVNHNLDVPASEAEKKKAAGGLTPARVEVGDYNQSKNGDMLAVHGVLRNVGASTAMGVRVGIAALGDKGETLASSEGTLSGGTIEPGQQIEFSAGLKVGPKIVTSLRFSPIWTPAPLPAPESATGSPSGSASSTSGGAAAGASTSGESSMSPDAKPAPKPPAPAPTPYGQGSLYAAPVPPSSMEPPKDGRGGYIPGATRKEDQPKPPQ